MSIELFSIPVRTSVTEQRTNGVPYDPLKTGKIVERYTCVN